MTLQHNNNPDHPISIRPADIRLKIELGGEVIADTTDALALEETTYPVAYYIPRRDVRMDLLTATDKKTHCPFKGDAGYWSVAANGSTVENGVWCYAAPMAEVSSIEGYLAFYTDRFEVSTEGLS
ncbi:MAG: DUF427 domain-containing protein [Alphaproteobacteria bacterium]|nr:DUF427 domain-containing protein [Alphaproteobacteria bacterium]